MCENQKIFDSISSGNDPLKTLASERGTYKDNSQQTSENVASASVRAANKQPFSSMRNP